MAVLLTMAHNKTISPNNVNNSTDDLKPTIFHDFLGRSCTTPNSSPAVAKIAASGDVRAQSELGSPSASASVGASSGGGGGRGPISTTSDLGSERQVGNHLEGVPYYGPRSDFSGSEIGNRFSGSKRSNSDSVFMGSRDVLPQMRPESMESSQLMKMLRSARGDRPRRGLDDEPFVGLHPTRTSSTSLTIQPDTSGRTDVNASKWDRAIPMNVGPVIQYPQRVGQAAPYGYQALSNRFKDTNVGPSILSQSAADEGSRTGIKGSGILSSVNVSGGVADRILPSTGKQKSGTCIPEPGSSTPHGRQGLTSSGCQMTIFYGGQAHVFDDVHPNKADVIMALAGSNGGSWSTSYTPNLATKQSGGESYPPAPSSENDTAGMASSSALPRDFRGRLYIAGNSSHGLGSSDRISMLAGGQQSSIVMKDARGSAQAAEPNTEDKREGPDETVIPSNRELE